MVRWAGGEELDIHIHIENSEWSGEQRIFSGLCSRLKHTLVMKWLGPFFFASCIRLRSLSGSVSCQYVAWLLACFCLQSQRRITLTIPRFRSRAVGASGWWASNWEGSPLLLFSFLGLFGERERREIFILLASIHLRLPFSVLVIELGQNRTGLAWH